MNPSHKMFLRMAGTIVLAVVGAGLAVSSAVYAAETVDASDDDRCYALKYTSNGKELITNLVCKDSNGVPYVPTNGPVTEGSNPKFTVNTAGIGVGKGMVLLNHNNNEGTGGVKVEDGHELTDELLKEVVKKACGDSMTCGSYQFSDSTISAAKNDEVWETFTQVEVPESSNDSEGEKTCASSGAGNSLGWILCPVLDLLSGAAETVYDDFVKPALQVEPQLFNAQNNPTRSAWTTFQMIANVAFIVLFLVVIFSQLTGVGIDNYGIKKILPKMIVAAVLINLSYLICIIAVDLSNILGNGLQALFEGISPDMSGVTEVGGVDLGGAAMTGMTGLALLGVLAIGIWGVVQSGGGVGILLTLLVSALGIAVAIFFLFILLAAREAAIVVLVVISPLAVVCYMLPNTKKLFDRWLKFGRGLLLVYPICGLLVGGGNFVSKLLLLAGAGQSGFFSAFMAMIIGVVPIFFIPTVLKSSFAAMGNLGAKISGLGKTMGNRLSGGTDKAIKGSERYKNYQTDLARRRQETAARSAIRRLDSKQRRNGQLNARDTLRLARSHETLDKMGREDRAASTVLAEREFANSTMPQLEEEWNRAFDSGNTQRLDALTNVMISKYGTSGANSIGRSLATKRLLNADGSRNEAAIASVQMLQDNMNHNSTFAGHMKNKAADAYAMISNGGMVRVNGSNEYRDMSYFSTREGNAVATDAKDWSTQSTATLQRAIASGNLDEEMVRTLLTSTDPAIQSGIQSDPSKRDLLQSYMYNRQNADVVGPPLPANIAAQRYREQQQTVQDADRQMREGMARDLSEINQQLHGRGGNPPQPPAPSAGA